MSDDVNSITSGSIWANIWQMSWPMLLIMLFNFLVGFTDIYVAGLISADVQAAIGFISQLYFLFIILGNAVSIGTVALVSRAIGARDRVRASEYAKQSLIFGIFVSVGLMLVGLGFSAKIVKFAGFPPELHDIARTFLIIYAIALIPNYVLIISNGIFRASAEVKKPLVTMFIFSLVNIIGDFALVFGYGPFPRLGYPGIAYATAVSVSISMTINVMFLFFSDWKMIFSGIWKPMFRKLRLIVHFGWPAGLLQVAWNAGSIVLYNILSRLGEESITAIAAITNGLRIEAIIFMPAFAMHMAASVLIGQNLGTKNPQRASQLGWKIAVSAMLVLSIISTVVFIWAEFFASLLAQDAAVLEETARYLRINMFSEPFMALSLVLSGALQGAGDTRGNMWVIIICMWFIRLPLAGVLAFIVGLGASGVWIAMVISMMIQGLLMSFRFARGKWKEIQIE